MTEWHWTRDGGVTAFARPEDRLDVEGGWRLVPDGTLPVVREESGR